ncbi:hypothetical protein [Konateibacter massiliensis]|uniref:hypothetical protein n=1 Tax=Konateibacter massiliensis TaxID=2002841 RepID=UPI000C15E818|nr:hypothetical protein [Konateibacter massiliensis]
MDTLRELQNAFKKDVDKEWVDKERKLMNDIVNYTCTQNGTSAIQGYEAKAVLEFLDKPAVEVKELLQIEDMDVKDLQTLMYALAPKVKKFGNFMT